MRSPPLRLGGGHDAPGSAIRTFETHRHQLVMHNIGPDQAMGLLHPGDDLVREPVRDPRPLKGLPSNNLAVSDGPERR